MNRHTLTHTHCGHVGYYNKLPSPGADPGFPIEGAPTLIGGGANLQHRRFLVKTYVKMEEFGPVGGGGCALETFVCRSATDHLTFNRSLAHMVLLCIYLTLNQMLNRKQCKRPEMTTSDQQCYIYRK